MALTTTTEQAEGRSRSRSSRWRAARRVELRAADRRRAGLRRAARAQILLDLGGLTFLASSGLVALHSIVSVLHGQAPIDLESGWGALHHLGHAGRGRQIQREVQLAGATPAVERVLQRTGLDRLFRPPRPRGRDRELLTPSHVRTERGLRETRRNGSRVRSSAARR